MHRSGTSVVAHGLGVLGVELGDNLHPAGFDNPKGFWEDRDILGINEELLSHIGSAYDRLGLIGWDMQHDPVIESLKFKAVQFVHEKCDKNALWGFKDPRTARLLPFWQAVFEYVGCDVGYVIAIRNPISVAESLRLRNGFEPEKSFYLWFEHITPIILRTRGKTRVVVDYDRLLENSRVELLRIARVLGLPAPTPSALAAYENEFLEKGLRHTRFTSQDLSLYPSVPPQVITAYDLLVKLALDDISLDNPRIGQAFEVLSQELLTLSPALNFIARQEQKLFGQIAERDRVIAERDARINGILASRSWRFTRPLRFLERLARTVFRKQR